MVWNEGRVYLSEALRREPVGLMPRDDQTYFGVTYVPGLSVGQCGGDIVDRSVIVGHRQEQQ